MLIFTSFYICFCNFNNRFINVGGKEMSRKISLSLSRLYPVDKTRVNEFGISYEEEEVNTKDQKQKKED